MCFSCFQIESLKHSHKLELASVKLECTRSKGELERERDTLQGQIDGMHVHTPLSAVRRGLSSCFSACPCISVFLSTFSLLVFSLWMDAVTFIFVVFCTLLPIIRKSHNFP